MLEMGCFIMFVKVCDSNVEPKTFIDFITEVAEDGIKLVIVYPDSPTTGVILVVEKGLDDGDCNSVSEFEFSNAKPSDLWLLTQSFYQKKVACITVEHSNDCFKEEFIFGGC